MMTKNGDNIDKLFLKATNYFLNEHIKIPHQFLSITADNLSFIFEDILNCSLKIIYKTIKNENKEGEGEKYKYIQNIEYIWIYLIENTKNYYNVCKCNVYIKGLLLTNLFLFQSTNIFFWLTAVHFLKDLDKPVLILW